MKKILTLGIAAIILLVSFSMVSFSVPAEDITGPFMVRDIGYPQPTEVLDQQMTTVTTNILENYMGQSFKAGVTGDLTQIAVSLSISGVGFLQFTIWNAIGDLPDGGPLGPAEALDMSGLASGWHSVPLSNPIPVVSGNQYAIVIDFTGVTLTNWNGYTTEGYIDGAAAGSTDGSSWWAVAPGYDMTFQTFVTSGSEGIDKVAWHPSGDFALGVTGDSNMIYRYARLTNTWVPEYSTGAEVDHFKDIVFDSTTQMFYMVGESNTWPFAYTWDATNGYLDRHSPPTQGGFFGVAPAGDYFDGSYNYAFLAVGYTLGGAAYAAWWSPNYGSFDGWMEATSGLDNEECLYDVCWDGRYDANSYYAVGYDLPNGYGVIYSFGTPGTTTAVNYVQDNSAIGILRTIEWCPDYASNDYCLIGGYYSAGQASNLFKWAGFGFSLETFRSTTDDYLDISWFPDGTMAVIVGKNGASGVVWYHNAGSTVTVNASTDLPSGTGPINGVACKGPSSPASAILAAASGGIGFFPSAADISTRITANAVFPHLYWIGFNDTGGGANLMDSQQMPSDWYNFTCVFNYSQGYNNCDIVVRAWHDQGAVQAASVYPAETEDNRVLAFMLIYNVLTDAYIINFPGSLEIQIGTGSDSLYSFVDGIEDLRYVELPIYLGPQIRSANGNGFGSADPDYDADPNIALQDANSWDFNITVLDSGNPTAYDRLFGEFGVNKQVSVSVVGNPTGNAPPGSASVALTNPSQITYSANTAYWVNVSIPNLLENGVGPASIAAINVEVENADPYADPTNSGISLPTAITGAGNDMVVWGTGVPVMPPSNGTVACGPWVSDYNAPIWTLNDYTVLDWWISVPESTSEGVYWAVITVTIDG